MASFLVSILSHLFNFATPLIYSSFSTDALSRSKTLRQVLDIMTHSQFKSIFKNPPSHKSVMKGTRTRTKWTVNFATTWFKILVQNTFSPLELIKTRQRNSIQLDLHLVLAVRSVPHNISQLMSAKQTWVSH